MGTTKIEDFTLRQNRLAKYMKVLGHPARIAIIDILVKHKACMCGEIVEDLPLSQSTVSQHLKELKEAGIIKGEIEGTKVCYCIDEKEWEDMKNYLENFLSVTLEKNKCC